MNKKLIIIVVLLFVVSLLFIVFSLKDRNNAKVTSKQYCTADTDCDCGVDKKTRACAMEIRSI